MVAVRVEQATKRFDQVLALDGVTVDMESSQFFFLLGPSGCGKTTLLRSIAGLVPLDGGRILFDDRLMNDVPAHRRNAALVFQNYALWPHMSVFDNVAFGLVERKVPKAERSHRVARALSLVHLAEAADRRPTELSGGQQQRVALARSLVVRPDLILLDEPLSNLDANLRHEMRYELKRIQEETGITMIYVTHDQKEALSMAHRIAVMKSGHVLQVGEPEELYRSPRSVFVARFVGRTNLVAGRVRDKRDGFVQVETDVGLLWGRSTDGADAPGAAVVCSVRPEHLQWNHERRIKPGPDAESSQAAAPGSPPPWSSITARLATRLFMGEVEERCYLAGDRELVAIDLASGPSAHQGDEADLVIRARDVVVLQPEEEQAS
ncbi:MAG: ABC transporter ATP-binding protein [Deltaproteobacteria bacterium]|nr:ABC transporter ATP-binding protein [Deltaproteobacteria bacterium]